MSIGYRKIIPIYYQNILKWLENWNLFHVHVRRFHKSQSHTLDFGFCFYSAKLHAIRNQLQHIQNDPKWILLSDAHKYSDRLTENYANFMHDGLYLCFGLFCTDFYLAIDVVEQLHLQRLSGAPISTCTFFIRHVERYRMVSITVIYIIIGNFLSFFSHCNDSTRKPKQWWCNSEHDCTLPK